MIHHSVDGPIARIELDRPPVNAIDADLVTGLDAALDAVMASEPTVVVFESRQKAFCAGADLAFIGSCFARENGTAEMVEYVKTLHTLFDRIESLPAVTLAVMEGTALGGGLELALACDLRIASTAARVGLPEAGVGMIPGAGGTQRLTRLCGPGVASQLILGAEVVTGAEAEQLGIVQWVADPDDVADRVSGITERVAGCSAPALAAAKACIAAWSVPDVDGFALEIEQPWHLMETDEARERIGAFLRKD